jgi:hypothetical protein
MQPHYSKVQQFCHLLVGATSNFFVQILIKINQKIAENLKNTPSKGINCPRSEIGTLKTRLVPVAYFATGTWQLFTTQKKSQN